MSSLLASCWLTPEQTPAPDQQTDKTSDLKESCTPANDQFIKMINSTWRPPYPQTQKLPTVLPFSPAFSHKKKKKNAAHIKKMFTLLSHKKEWIKEVVLIFANDCDTNAENLGIKSEAEMFCVAS